MKVAIDIDGTLTAWPKQIEQLVSSLRSLDSSVVFLTGHSCQNPGTVDMASLVTGRVEQVSTLGRFMQSCTGPLGTECVVVCVGRNSSEVAEKKATFCRDNNVDLFIDDSKNYCEAVRRVSQKTMVLLVYP